MMVTPGVLMCTKCQSPLPETPLNQPEPLPCPGCASRLEVIVFPAFYRAAPETPVGESVVTNDEASCFVHSQKRAVAPCDSCGRFICALCDVVIRDEHLCPECLEKGVRKKKHQSLEKRRFLYDTLAVQVAVLPLIIWPFTIFTAPAALYVCVRYWKEPLGLLRRSHWRFVVAGLIALVQLAFWAFLFALLWGRFSLVGRD